MKNIFILLLLALAAYGQQKRVAIVNTVDDGDQPIGHSELNHLTDRLREIAVKTLPQKTHAVMTQQSIVSFLGSQEEAAKKCSESEGCLAKLGREINADYIGQARIGRFGGDLAIKTELYDTKSGNLIGSFTGSSKDVFGLLSVIDKEAPGMFGRMQQEVTPVPPISTPVISSARGYLVNLNTIPSGAGAVLSFNGSLIAKCTATPCKLELRNGNVRIIASLEQYGTADTTVFIAGNNQNVTIALKPNFGALEIKPAYLNDVGKDKGWNLTINDKPYSFGEVKLYPNKYTVKLSHECYENIGFEVNVQKGKRDILDIARYTALKKGGLVLNTVRSEELVSEPVFVNGKLVGKTPFKGSIPICSKIEVGINKEEVGVKLQHNGNIEYTLKMQTQGQFTDGRDGKAYKYTTIGSQVWMAENLNYNANGSRCYDNEQRNCQKYGKLYDLATAKKACPAGWHLPSNEEWDILYSFVDRAGSIKSPYESKTAGKYLKAINEWNGNDNEREKIYGFTALPGGYGSSDGNFNFIEDYGYWWSSTEYSADGAYGRHISYDDGAHWNYNNKSNLCSVRCVQDKIQNTEIGKNNLNKENLSPDFSGALTEMKEQNKKENNSKYLAFALDLAGAVFLYLGYENDKELVDKYYEYGSMGIASRSTYDKAWEKVEDTKSTRNIYYVLGGLLLTSGIGIHIWF